MRCRDAHECRLTSRYGASPDRGNPQAGLSALDQLLPQADNAPITLRREGVGMMMGRTGTRGKAHPRMLRAIPSPLVHLAAAAMKFLRYDRGADAGSIPLYRCTTQLRLSLIPSGRVHVSPPEWR